jgi:hypothetical protein
MCALESTGEFLAMASVEDLRELGENI